MPTGGSSNNATQSSEGMEDTPPAIDPGVLKQVMDLLAPALGHRSAPVNPPPPLKLDAESWKLWKQTWDNYVVLTKLADQPPDYQLATLLSCIGIEALKIYNSMSFATDEDPKSVDVILAKFQKFAIGEKNITYERYIFNSTNQEEDSVDMFVAKLQSLAKTCNFCDCLNESLIRDRIVLGIRNNDIRKRLLQVQDLSLQKCIDICKAAEATDVRYKHITEQPTQEPVHKIQAKKKSWPKGQKASKPNYKPTDVKVCHFCYKKHEMKKSLCPAWGKKCKQCGGMNHFAIKHKKETVRSVGLRYEDPVEDEYSEFISTVTVSAVKSPNKLIYAQMIVEGHPVTFQIDCGASVNIITRKHLAETTQLTPPRTTLEMWNTDLLKPVGEARVAFTNPATDTVHEYNFVVVEEDFMPLLGAATSLDMKLITVNSENFRAAVRTVKNLEANKHHDLLNTFKDTFSDGLGTLPGEVHLEVDKTISPVISATRRIPVSMRAKLKEELAHMTETGVIEVIDEPTDWVSSLALTQKKNGDLRICIDPRPLNKALKRERYELPVLDDLLPELANAKIFSTLDLKNGFWHVKLDEESSRLTTFSTPFGRYKWKRLPFGLSVSSEIFQKRLHQAVGDLPGVLCVADDLMIYGVGETIPEAERDHDAKLEKLLSRCRTLGIKLNMQKLNLHRESLPFLGHLITNTGLKPDPEKVEAILKMPQPTNVAGVQRLQGIINYLAKFLPRISDVMLPIRQLTKTRVPWTWGEAQSKAFDEIKQLISQSPLLRYYVPHKPLTIQCDASEKGLGTVLLQEGQPLAYASRALSDTEVRYAQIEKELLAIVYSCEKFHQYTYGNHVTVLSDHKPLEALMKKPLMTCPRRLQNMLMRLQGYNITVIYTPGKHMHLADALSRAYLPGIKPDIEIVNVAHYLPITEPRLDELRQATEEDYVLQTLKSVILSGWPDNKDDLPPGIEQYFPFRTELTVHDGLVFKGEQVIVPTTQRAILKQKVHLSHLGVEGCIRRARESLYWPNMSTELKQYISNCEICSQYQPAQTKETLMSHEVPSRPWAKIGTDLFTLDNRNYLITVDYMSNFWELDYLPDTESKTIIHKLKMHFARYGIPDQIVSDNGPQFASREFTKFASTWNFAHTPSSPGNSRANGKAESAVKTAKSLLRKAKDSNSDPYLVLLDHRNTPSHGFDTSPVQRLMSRRTKTLLPTTDKLLQPEVQSRDVFLRHNARNQQRQANYYNKNAHDLSPLEEGDVVRIQPFVKKDTWKKAVVTKRLDQRSYEIESDGTTYRRNRVHLNQKPNPTVNNQTLPEATFEQSPSRPTAKEIMPNTPTVPTNASTVPTNTPHVPTNTPRVPTNTPHVPKNVPKATRAGRVIKPPPWLKEYSSDV